MCDMGFLQEHLITSARVPLASGASFFTWLTASRDYEGFGVLLRFLELGFMVV